MGRIKQISDGTKEEVETYLNHLEWTDNPFNKKATVDNYVMPSKEDIADIISHINEYSGPILVHSEYSGVGKTTLLKIILDDLKEEYHTIYIGEHNVTPYELIAIVADKIGVGKSSSTKLTEEKIYESDFDKPILLGIDEFGLNDPDTLHTIQYLNDEIDCKIILTGMTSQWNAIEKIGSEGKAFQRRVSFQHKLEPFTQEQTKEFIKRRITTATNKPYDKYESIQYDSFITDEALEEIHTRSSGVAGVISNTLSDALSLVAYMHTHNITSTVDTNLVDELTITDPYADTT